MPTLEKSSDSSLPKVDGATCPYLFIVMQTTDLTASPARFCLEGVTEVEIGRGERSAEIVERGDRHTLVLKISDPWISLRHATLSRSAERWRLIDHGSKNGSVVDGRRAESTMLHDAALIEVGATLLVLSHVVTHTFAESGWIDPDEGPPRLHTLLPALQRQLVDLERIARSGTSILLLGETGTGKEVLANIIHRLSARRGRFIAVNCGGLPPALVESELFGHRKGAFSGASETRLGFVRSADHGTLLLDEIGDLPKQAQAALLRVLQQREVTPVGEHQAVPIDLRVCAATHRELDDMVADGCFRRDLLMRLEGYVFRLPPVRQRRVDLGLLIRALLRRLAPASSVRISSRAAHQLLHYSWPGNVRELEKCLESSLALAGGGRIDLGHLPEKLRGGDARTIAPVAVPRASALIPVEIATAERALDDRIRTLLHEHGGNVAAVSRATGKHPFQIHRWIKRFGIDVQQFRKTR
jgi:transcriptional regulator of acetoin/glycerol metabolism